ncbi:MAG: bifunctional DNA primase/polymerase, partial [Patescibacteria group bacterium]
MERFKDLVKIGVTFPKDNVKLPKEWNKITSSIYNNEKNFAVLTGKINDIIVIDLDNKDPEFIAYKWLRDNLGDIYTLNTLITNTINKGYHIFFKYTTKIKNINNKEFNIDILSDSRCCYQGDKYDVLFNNAIRELTEEEIAKILSLKKSININIEDSVKLDKSYKKANEMLRLPVDTKWDITKSTNGHKIVPNCLQCLVDPNIYHKHDEHSSIFINDDKSVVKSCFSHGTEIVCKKDANKLMQHFNIILHTQENTVYQELVSDLIDEAKEFNYKREEGSGIVYK